jgi:hypothetical protein
MNRSRCSSHLDRRQCSQSFGTVEMKGMLKIPVACNFGRMVTGRNDVSSLSSFPGSSLAFSEDIIRLTGLRILTESEEGATVKENKMCGTRPAAGLGPRSPKPNRLAS